MSKNNLGQKKNKSQHEQHQYIREVENILLGVNFNIAITFRVLYIRDIIVVVNKIFLFLSQLLGIHFHDLSKIVSIFDETFQAKTANCALLFTDVFCTFVLHTSTNNIVLQLSDLEIPDSRQQTGFVKFAAFSGSIGWSSTSAKRKEKSKTFNSLALIARWAASSLLFLVHKHCLN